MSVSKHPTVRLHHVGIAVNSVDGTSAALERILGLAFDAPLSVDAQKVKIAYSNGDGAALELVEATSDKSPLYPILDHSIRAFITKHGEGMHHLCFEVEDLDTLLDTFANEGVDTIGGGVLEGSHDGRVAFLNPASCAGLLIELRESQRD
jgi:methylmalonyl-CoA epimerase